MAVVFAVTGMTFATWASRIPAVQERLELSEGQLGLALLGLTASAVAGLPASGALVSRWGARRVTTGGLFVYCFGLIPLSVVPSLPTLALALALFGAGNSAVDVGMNVQAVASERHFARPILGSLHAMFSVGTVAGAGVGALAAAAGIPPTVHFSVAAAVLLPAGIAAVTVFDRHVSDAAPAALRLPDRPLLLLGVIAFAAFIAEGVLQDWSAVYLRTEIGAGPGIAAAGFAMFVGAMTLGRLATDRIVLRVGPRRYAFASSATATAGFAIAVVAPSTGVVIAGYALIGLGLSGLAPLMFSLAGHRSAAPAGPAIAAVSTIGYLGFLAGPPLVGGIAEAADLRVALSTVGLFALAVGGLAIRLPRRHPARR